MIAIERHVTEAKDTSVCLVYEANGGLGGGRVIWEAATCVAKSTRRTSFVVVPQLEHCRHAPNNLGTKEQISVVAHDDVHSLGLVPAVRQAVARDSQRARDINLRVVILENASELALSHSMADIIALLKECKASGEVHAVFALLQQNAHPPREISAVSTTQTCNVTLEPVRPLLADMIQQSQGRHVHVQLVVSLIRHSGRVRVEKQLFSMTSQGGLRLCNVKLSPAGEIVHPGTSSSARRPTQEEQEELNQKRIQSKYEKEMSGFMKLTLSDKDQERKAKIVLPWQHEGGTQPEAPYKSSATGGASIVYVRDSDQDYDSDEDPDDDLDL